MSDHLTAPFSAASITWGDDGIPRSSTFDDVYFSLHDGWEESRHAFLQGAQVVQRWINQKQFTIGETGFGTGRNFLLTWKAWRDDPQRPDSLDYLSVEGFPLSARDLAQALANSIQDPALRPLADELVAAWPAAHPGFHLRLFDQGRVRLLLLFGDVAEVLPQVTPPPAGGFDGWYLDGFAPSKNPDMWSPALYHQIARLSKPGARFGTYAAAGHVRRGVTEAGFQVERRPGHGHKRECLAGVYQPAEPTVTTEKPWFRSPSPLPAGANVAVIGGGVAGCAMAAALSRRGLTPTLFERHHALAQEGSGNPCGLLKPRLTADGGIHGRFYAQATLFAQAQLPPEAWVSQGIFHLARDAEEAALQERLAQTLAPGHAQPLNAAQAAELAQVEAPFGGLWFPFAGAIRPQAVCAALLSAVPTPVRRLTASVAPPEPCATGGWLVQGESFDAVVLTAGAYSKALYAPAELPIFCNRGQISVLAEQPDSPLPTPALSFGGYLSPRFSDPTFAPSDQPLRVLGATYRRLPSPEAEDWSQLSDADHQAVADDLAAHLPAVAQALKAEQTRLGGRAALRATIADHMPLAGPLFQATDFRQDFAELHHGRRPSSYPAARWAEGLFILGGLGSRGFQTAPLLAEHLAATMVGTPSPLPQDLAEAVHPARFLVRALKKAPKRGQQKGKKISPAPGLRTGD
jgi:tRNA 5-methylaminomethyl-2-thiouridine biosynthesis bifunctional protein